MGWTVTSVASQLGRRIGVQGSWASRYDTAHAYGLAQRGHVPNGDTVTARLFRRRLGVLNAADRKALEVAASQAGDDAAIIERAAAAGAPVPAIAALSASLDSLSGAARDVIRHPAGVSHGQVRFGAVAARQVDGTTCGPASMAMMVMIGDPFVTAWLMTGRRFAGHLPPEARQADIQYPDARTIEQRWHALQRVIHSAVNVHGLGPVPWPRSLGTPPWRVDDHSRFSGLRFRGAMLDDTDEHTMRAAIAHASAALRDGIPVPLYTGGDSTGGLSAVVPRHVVLLTALTDNGFTVYEPGAARALPLPFTRVLGGGPREPALGNWSRMCWMVLPRPRRR